MPKFTAGEVSVDTSASNLDYAFANEIIDIITRQHRLPLALHAEDVFNEVRTNMFEWYELWPDATQDDQLSFSTAVLRKPEQYLPSVDGNTYRLHTNQVLMPPAVYGVYECFYVNSYAGMSQLSSYALWRASSILVGPLNSGQGLDLDQYMASVFVSNLSESLVKEPVLHSYNQDSRILQVYDAADRHGMIICKVARMLPIETFFNNAWFRMFIVGHVLNARADHFELFGSPALPGDLQINVSVLRNRAQDLLQRVREQMTLEASTAFYAIKS